MGVFTFDWMQILYIGSPLMIPWWAQANAMAGFVVFYWIICPILYYCNVSFVNTAWTSLRPSQVWYSSYMPISTGAIMDRYGEPYNITSVLHQTLRGKLDEDAYHTYSPVFISASFSITYTIAFALSTAAIVHTLLHHGPQLWHGLRKRQVEIPDIHAKLMRSYSPVPFW
jgi:hypothetical protein